MKDAALQSVRGWCPGALRPMESGDGLIVRLRPRRGTFSVAVMAAIAKLAESHGNGHIDLTRRANVQIRGLSEDRLASLWATLAELGLLDATADAEAVRNVMVSPLAGLDPSEEADVRPLAGELEEALGAERDLWRLPGKFGFAVDEGGLLSLACARADIWLKAIPSDNGPGVLIGVDRPTGVDWIGLAKPYTAAAAAIRAARVFLDVRPDTHARMRDLRQSAHDAVCSALAPHLERAVSPPAVHRSERLLGEVSCGGTPVAVGVAAPFGRVEARALRALAAAARDLGVSEFRPSPWRILYAPATDADTATALSAAAAANGFIVDAGDPLLSIEACPGTQGCRSTGLDTRAAARRLAPLLARLGYRSCHVSGCSKGCACSRTTELVLVGAGERFGVLRHDTAQGQPHLFVSPERISDLPELLETVLKPAAMVASRSYIRDGAEIYRNSFAIIRAEADLTRFTGRAEKVAVRIIHASGMVEIARDIAMSEDFADKASAALLAGAPILCDAQMVSHGITRARLPAGNEVICTLADPSVPELAQRLGTTRSAAAVDLWRPHLAGAVVAIGNAPTALFRLLEIIDEGGPKPAAVVGVPVGFVGAAESKEALRGYDDPPSLIVTGRKGGSAIAVAAVNALASEKE